MAKDQEAASISCPLCGGKGSLSQELFIEKLGMKDISRVAELTAAQALEKLAAKNAQEGNALWVRFEREMERRLTEVNGKHQEEVAKLKAERDASVVRQEELEKRVKDESDLARSQQKAEDLRRTQEEVAQLRGKLVEIEAKSKTFEKEKTLAVEAVRQEFGQKLSAAEGRLAILNEQQKSLLEEKGKLEQRLEKTAVRGRAEEVDFRDEVSDWPGFWISDKLPKNGDYILALRGPDGEPLEASKILIDNKDKGAVTTSDIEKLIDDAKKRKLAVASLVVREESGLRQEDRDRRWDKVDGIWVHRTTREWFRRDLDLLKPVLRRMVEEGPAFLERSTAVVQEIRSTLADADEIDRHLEKAIEHIKGGRDRLGKFKQRIEAVCGQAGPTVGRKGDAPEPPRSMEQGG